MSELERKVSGYEVVAVTRTNTVTILQRFTADRFAEACDCAENCKIKIIRKEETVVHSP